MTGRFKLQESEFNFDEHKKKTARNFDAPFLITQGIQNELTSEQITDCFQQIKDVVKQFGMLDYFQQFHWKGDSDGKEIPHRVLYCIHSQVIDWNDKTPEQLLDAYKENDLAVLNNVTLMLSSEY